MIILSIETSCDETAVSIVEASGGLESLVFKVLGNALFSQIDIHKQYGGVYPMMAKREHARNLPTILVNSLKQANMYKVGDMSPNFEIWQEIENILIREEGLFEGLRSVVENVEKPNVDVISVTSGPGLAPALWVGIVFAQALGKLWDIPVIGVNHMEGHIASVLMENTNSRPVQFPALALLISGGHTELVEIENWGKYFVLGQTVDDAVGEAFDKTARLLGFPYPVGPEISRLAEYAREKNIPRTAKLPRPMIHSNNLNFSFSGLKTAVLYYIRDNFNGDAQIMSSEQKADLAREFEDAVIEVLVNKTEKALAETEAKTLIIGGGVIANKKIKGFFLEFETKYPGLIVKTPTKSLATDNAIMIAVATYINTLVSPNILNTPKNIMAEGNLKLG